MNALPLPPSSSSAIYPSSTGLRLYVLGEQSEPKALGEAGELYVAGAGVARGYLKRPDLTAERFTPDPFYPGQMMYRTGDEVKWIIEEDQVYHPSSSSSPSKQKTAAAATTVLAYLGRMDSQVKINGFRIELGEIEKVLQQHHTVGGAVVCCREDIPGRPKALVAYIMPSSSSGGGGMVGVSSLPSIEDIRDHLSRALPSYMVPDFYVFLSSFPLSPNGKVDRKALPPPASSHTSTHKAIGGAGEEEVEGGSAAGGSSTTGGGPNWSDSSLSADEEEEEEDDDDDSQMEDEESGLVVVVQGGGNRKHSSSASTKSSPMVNLVTRLIREQSGAEVGPSSSMSAIGLDSLGMVMILSKLSHSLGGLRVPPTAVFEHETVGDFATYLARRVQQERPDLLASLGMITTTGYNGGRYVCMYLGM